MTVRLVACSAALLVLPAGVAGQELRTAVSPDTARVGDVVLAAVRIELPAGYRAEFPDSLAVAGDVENAGRRSETAEPLPGGGQRLTVIYPVTAWRPGEARLPTVPVRVVAPDGDRRLEAALPALAVTSVLPADTAGIEPRPAKGVLGASWLLWPFLVGLLALVAGVGAVGYWLRRRGEAPELALVPRVPPRERALAALDRARALGLVELGEFKAFYSLVTEAVRRYLEALDPAWGTDLTTSELLERFGREVDDDVAGSLGGLLAAADLVKFARRTPTPGEALAEWSAARAWVEGLERKLPSYAEPPEGGGAAGTTPPDTVEAA